ncbi:MAG TPA: hypothetical protein VK203_26060 [Nostocaceae cyanobacterium]|nr:hypothetical protein [Nostocaceae cyanobacterium]
MKFDWSNYLKLAKTLLAEVDASLNEVNDSTSTPIDPGINEAKLRCLISRAYYSVFCLARNYLIEIDHDIEVENSKKYNTNVHEDVITKFRYSQDTDYHKISNNLYSMRKYRNEADYNDCIPYHLLNTARNTIDLANRTIILLEKLKNKKLSQK